MVKAKVVKQKSTRRRKEGKDMAKEAVAEAKEAVVVSVPNTLQSWKAAVSRRMQVAYPVLAAASYVEDYTAGIGTFCINPQSIEIRYNPEFASKNTVEENGFILSHEAWHFIGDHITRRLKRSKSEGTSFDFPLWQLAEEESTNEVVAMLTGWPCPKDCVQPSAKRTGLTVEQRYEHMKTDPGIKRMKVCIHCIQGGTDGTGDPKDGSSQAAVEMIRSSVGDIVAKQVQKMLKEGKLQPGNMPGELKEIANRFTGLSCPPKWDQLLGRFLRAMDLNCKHFDHATIYQRRIALDGLCLPNLSSSPKIKRGIISIDNSGSVSDVMFSKLVGTVESMAKQLGFTEFIIQHFTTQVMRTIRVTNLRGVQNISRQADGGTALGDCDMKAGNHRGQFHLILTDGYVDWLPKYSMPTIIIRTVPSTSEPPVVVNLVGSIIIDAEKDFGE